jgi:osmoprotectant transport system permease protein
MHAPSAHASAQLLKGDPLIKNQPLCLQAVVIVLAAVTLPFLTHAPNRLVSGQGLSLWGLPSAASLALLVPGLALVGGAFLPQTQRLARLLGLASVLFLAGLVYVASLAAEALGTAAASDAARTSFGSGFWVMAIAAALALADLMSRAGLSPVGRVIAGLVATLPIAAMIVLGQLDAMSIMVEYANKAEVFRRAVGEHLMIVLAAMVPTLLIGIPLGVLVHRKAAFAGPIMSVLNVIQTIPSIALFGLLIAPLSALVVMMPGLTALGISGIGLAPAIIALTLYSILPIVRNTSEGLAGVPHSVIEAARGMGMTRSEVFWQAEAPLALPVFLSGLRVTVVQAIGLAAVAALIGAGGLGSIMFQGLFSNALDLVLLGALPIIAIAVLADALFKLALAVAQRRTP